MAPGSMKLDPGAGDLHGNERVQETDCSPSSSGDETRQEASCDPGGDAVGSDRPRPAGSSRFASWGCCSSGHLKESGFSSDDWVCGSVRLEENSGDEAAYEAGWGDSGSG